MTTRFGKQDMSIQIVQKSGEGLSRVFGVTVPAGHLAAKLDEKIAEISPKMQLKGFRPGKVPAAHVRKMYGKGLMQEIVEATLQESQAKALEEAKLRPAAAPDVKFEGDIEKVLDGGVDLTFELSVELMPEFEPVDLSTIELTRPVYEPTEDEVAEQLKAIAEQNRTFEKKGGKAPKAADGDQLVIDFIGRIDGEAFEGGTAEDVELVIGSGRFIPGFEEQLTGAKNGADVTVKVKFPEDYQAENLKGKDAEFEVKVKEIRAPKDSALDDEFAKQLGLDDLAALKQALKDQLSRQYANASRFKAKRALLDVLDEKHSFELPPRMVENEFQVIWQQVEAEKAAGELSDEDKEKTDEQLRAEYQKIAERRVRLGLVLAEVGRRNDVQVSEQEMNQALIAEARRYPGQEREVIQFYQQNQQAAAQLRAPVYEEKVVDLIFSKAKIEDKSVSKDELFAEDDLPEGYSAA
jgi:trigger factor